MSAVRICHELKLLIILDQFVKKHLCILIVNIVVSCSVDIKQVAFQVFSVSDR